MDEREFQSAGKRIEQKFNKSHCEVGKTDKQLQAQPNVSDYL